MSLDTTLSLNQSSSITEENSVTDNSQPCTSPDSTCSKTSPSLDSNNASNGMGDPPIIEQQGNSAQPDTEIANSRDIRSLSLPSPVHSSLHLPINFPFPGNMAVCPTINQGIGILNQHFIQPGAICPKYPHISLPLNTPPYLFSDQPFTPCPQLLSKLVEMGISEVAGSKALYWTGNSCIERATSWIFERPEEILKTPLEVEIEMFRADLEVKEEEMRKRMQSIDSGVCITEEDIVTNVWKRKQMEVGLDSDTSEEFEEYKLVIVVNMCCQLNQAQLVCLVGKATMHLFGKISCEENGEEEMDLWEYSGQKVVTVEGDNSRHLLDLKLAAESLGLRCGEVVGGFWNRMTRRFTEMLVLAIWGEEEEVMSVVGRLKHIA